MALFPIMIIYVGFITPLPPYRLPLPLPLFTKSTLMGGSEDFASAGRVAGFHASSLPHQYVMDSTNMELLVGTGGTVNIEPEQAVCLALGVDWMECKKAVCDAMGKTEAQCNYNGPDAEVNNAQNGEGAPPE